MSETCPLCGVPDLVKTSGTVPFVGAQDVYLDGVDIWNCSSCGESLTEYPALRKVVDHVVLKVALRQGRLAPIDVKLLLQHLSDAAPFLGVDPQKVEGWKYGFLPLSPSEESLLRLAVAFHHKSSELLEALLVARNKGPRQVIRVDVGALLEDHGVK